MYQDKCKGTSISYKSYLTWVEIIIFIKKKKDSFHIASQDHDYNSWITLGAKWITQKKNGALGSLFNQPRQTNLDFLLSISFSRRILSICPPSLVFFALFPFSISQLSTYFVKRKNQPKWGTPHCPSGLPSFLQEPNNRGNKTKLSSPLSLEMPNPFLHVCFCLL